MQNCIKESIAYCHGSGTLLNAMISSHYRTVFCLVSEFFARFVKQRFWITSITNQGFWIELLGTSPTRNNGDGGRP